MIGVLNTLKVAVVGIVLATILGTLIGIGRLSKNWLMARLTAFYVETIRDIPLLLQLLFWYTILQGLPAPRNAMSIGGAVWLSNRGLKLPTLNWETAHTVAFLMFIAGLVGTWWWNHRARLRHRHWRGADRCRWRTPRGRRRSPNAGSRRAGRWCP